MSTSTRKRLAYAALALVTGAAVIVGLLFHFASNGEQWKPWVFPLCMLTFAAALVTDRYVKRLKSEP